MSIRALLPEYVSIQILGQEAPASWHLLEHHLAHCPACRSEAEALLQFVSASYQEDAQPIPQPPPPDLSFLRPSRVATSAHRSPALSARLHQFIIQFSPSMLSTMRIAMTACSGVERLHYVYYHPPAHPTTPDISIEVLTRNEQAERDHVCISVELPDNDPFDQAGGAVTLTIADLHLSAITDQNGVVSFHDVPLDQIEHWRITVTPHAASGG